MKNKIQFWALDCPNSITFGIVCFVLCLTSCSPGAENRPSPLRRESTMIGDVKIKLNYSSPAVRERKVWGELVKYDVVWRTGANEASVFETDRTLMVDTFLLEAGKYSIFTIPGKEMWKVVFNKDWDQWGSYHYTDSLDAVALWVTPKQTPSSEERMRFFFENDSLKFHWEQLTWGIALSNSL